LKNDIAAIEGKEESELDGLGKDGANGDGTGSTDDILKDEISDVKNEIDGNKAMQKEIDTAL
jgi:hypothetical protein